MNYDELKRNIADVVKPNGNQEITGQIMQDALFALIENLGAGYQFGGVVATSDAPTLGSDVKAFYLAKEKGVYASFGGVEVTEVSVITYDGAYRVYGLGIAFGTDTEAEIAELDARLKALEADGSVTTPKIADKAVTGAKINDGAVGTSKLATRSVTTEKIKEGAVTSTELADGSVTTAILGTDVKNSIAPMQEVTWNELKALRDAKKLVAGKTYRITDFVTTTAQADTRSAGHAFDILVVADDAGTLNENARAVLHSGDTYFAQSDLSAWRLMYCLDNDDTRFAWADTENGKGVIFRMIDEWENDVPYDFKNIQFKRYKVTQTDERYDGVFTDGYYGVSQGFNGVEVSATDSIWAYTFSVLDVDRDSAEIKWDEDLQDASVHQGASNDPDGGGYLHPILHCEKNSLQPTNVAEIVDDSMTTIKQTLNNGVFYSLYHWFEEDDVVRHELEHCAFNEFGNSYDFTLSVCSGNKTGVACYGFLCDNYCSSWTCGNNCNSWTCGNNCNSWTCGNNCNSWTCGNNCNSWTCGNFCYYWTCGNNCHYWTCGNDCHSWTCGNNCSSWTCGNDCHSWTCGNNCNSWTCGNNCNSWTCGNFVNDVSIPQNNVLYFHLASGTRYVNIRSNGTPTGSTPLKNFEVKGGIVGDSDSSRVDIVIPTTDFPLGAQYTWTIAKNSKGEIKQYCEADLIN